MSETFDFTSRWIKSQITKIKWTGWIDLRLFLTLKENQNRSRDRLKKKFKWRIKNGNEKKK